MRRRWLFSRSLIYPLTAVLVCLAVVPVALVGWGFVSSNREQVETLEMQYLTRQAVGLTREIELYFLDSVGRIETIGGFLRLQAGAHELPTFSTALADSIRGNHHILLLRLLDATGRGPYVQGPGLSSETERALDPLLGEAFRANARGLSIKRDFVRVAGEGLVVLVSLPIVGVDREWVGAIQGAVSLQGIAERIAAEQGRAATVDVVDRTGEVVFSSDVGRVRRSAVRNPLVMQFLNAPVRLTRIGVDPLRGGGREVLGSLCPVEGVPWAVVAARDVDVAFAAVTAMARRTAVLVISAGLVAMLAGILLARRITLPLRHVADITSAVASGDYAQRAPVGSRNELGQLAANFNVMTAEVERYIKSLRQALRDNQELLVDAIRALAAAIDAKNPYTRGHSERVSTYSVAIARRLGIAGEDLQRVEISSLLHDVGKIGIVDAILEKPERLSDDEFQQMRTHVVKGAAIVSPIKRLHSMLPGIRSHHENWSGGGYPDGLKGTEIPVLARIIAAADVFDAITTRRPYQSPMGLKSALQRMRELGGQRLDPDVVEAFFAAVEAGELVPLAEMENAG